MATGSPGYSYSYSEIVNIANATTECVNWHSFSQELFGATGGFLGTAALICGGQKNGYENKCYVLTQTTISYNAYHLYVGRSGASSIVVNSTHMWVLGGDSTTSYGASISGGQSSTEYITMEDGHSYGPTMPLTNYNFAAVKLNSSSFLMIGGRTNVADPSDRTYYYDSTTDNWNWGPYLNQKRYSHAAAVGVDLSLIHI